jgi:uncharacterized membrane protein YqiK
MPGQNGGAQYFVPNPDLARVNHLTSADNTRIIQAEQQAAQRQAQVARAQQVQQAQAIQAQQAQQQGLVPVTGLQDAIAVNAQGLGSI